MHRFHNAKILNWPLQLKEDLHIYTSFFKKKKKKEERKNLDLDQNW